MSNLRKDKSPMECPSCGNKEGNLFRLDNSISKPRPEYLCAVCRHEWHYSRQGNAVSGASWIWTPPEKENPAPRKHITHFDDCGCLSATHKEAIKALLPFAKMLVDCALDSRINLPQKAYDLVNKSANKIVSKAEKLL